MTWRACAAAFFVLVGAEPAAAEEQPLICFGNEPSWSVDLTQPGRAVFSTPDAGSTEFRGTLARSEPLNESLWRGTPASAAGRELVVFLSEGACSDGMSDTVHPVNARVSSADGRFLAGCCRVPAGAGAAMAGGVAGARAAGTAALTIEGPVWQVERVSGVDESMIAAARPALDVRFHSGRVEGFSGCNRIAGGYTLDGPRIRLSPLAGTMMMCDEPAMTRESAFRKLLSGTLDFSFVDGRLVLSSPSGATATLREAPAPSLEGVTWEVTGYNNGRMAVVSPRLGTSLSLAFADGAVSGSAGCNSFRAVFTAEAGTVAIGPVMTTRMHCSGEGVMEQERAFLSALEKARVWTVRSDMLDMHFEGGETRALTARPK